MFLLWDFKLLHIKNTIEQQSGNKMSIHVEFPIWLGIADQYGVVRSAAGTRDSYSFLAQKSPLVSCGLLSLWRNC
jgi:hypothetical protein